MQRGLILLFLLFCFSASAETQGPFTAATNSGTNWTTPENTAAADDAYAIYNNTSQDYLKLTNFGFYIPSDATVTGIEMIFEANGTSVTASARQFKVTLTKDNVSAIGTEKTAIALSQGTDRYSEKGSSADLWGTTWTPAEVNSANFGIWIADNDISAAALNFDHVFVIVHYTPAAGFVSSCVGGAKYAGPSTAGTNAGTNWTNPENTAASDDARAVYNNTGQNYLYLTNFGFAIPTAAKITGIVVRREGNGTNGVIINRAYKMGLTKDASSVSGDTLHVLALPQTTDDTVDIGAGGYLWGTTWTPAEVNSANFGVMITDSDTTAQALNIDYVAVTVCYTGIRTMVVE